jgi:formate hydrogenlyase transcriptional activator
MSEAGDPQRAQLESRLRFEALLAELSSEFVNLQPGLIDGAIEHALRRLVEALDVDRGALTELSADDNTLDFTHYWSRAGLAPAVSVPARELYPFGLGRILKGEVHCFSSLSDLPPDVPDRDSLESAGILSAAAVPLIAAGRVIGSLSFTSTRERLWDPAIVDRFPLVAAVFASALARKRADADLRAVVEGRLAFETLIADLSSGFINLDSALIDGAIEAAQRRIVEALDIDRSSLYQISKVDSQLTFTHYWSRPDVPVPDLSIVIAARFPWTAAKMMAGEMISFASLDELPMEAALDRETYEKVDTKSSVAIPLQVAERTVGAVAFNAMRHERQWTPDVLNRLRVVAAVFASALARKRADAELRAAVEGRIAFETLIADLSSRFVNLDSTLIDGAIEDAQRRLVEALDIDRSALFQVSEAHGALAFTHFWSRPEHVGPDPSFATVATFPWTAAKLMKGELVSLSSLDELPEEAAVDRRGFETVGTKSNVTVPLIVSGRIIGALTFAAIRHERQWPPELLNRLRVVAEVFASALARKRVESELRQTLEENVQLRERLSQENVYLRQEVKARAGSQAEVTGRSQAIRQVLELVAQVAPTGATVLLLGETGTGKELIATAIHEQSSRRGCTMVRVNCAAIPVALIESELFGREKGAYTGALARQAGRFELANGSTIFLDEIGELTADVQVKLLRVLQEKQIDRLGGSRSIDLDLRIIAATNRDLDQAVSDGTFREDLYYRLNVFPIHVPPLRERVEDIPTLVWAFVDEFSKTMGKRVESISKEQMAALQRYSWPGNIRELRNVVEHAVIVSNGPRLKIEPPGVRSEKRRYGSTQLADVEREHIRSVLERTGWRIRGHAGAAELLNLKPSTLEGRMEKLGLRRPRP